MMEMYASYMKVMMACHKMAAPAKMKDKLRQHD